MVALFAVALRTRGYLSTALQPLHVPGTHAGSQRQLRLLWRKVLVVGIVVYVGCLRRRCQRRGGYTPEPTEAGACTGTQCRLRQQLIVDSLLARVRPAVCGGTPFHQSRSASRRTTPSDRLRLTLGPHCRSGGTDSPSPWCWLPQALIVYGVTPPLPGQAFVALRARARWLSCRHGH